MIIKNIMSKEETKNKLKKLGVNPRLLEMPAVLERLSRKSARGNFEFQIDGDGSIQFENGKFVEQEDGTVKYVIDAENEVLINKYGMDEEMFYNYTVGESYVARTSDGKIKYEEVDLDSNFSTIKEDDGDWELDIEKWKEEEFEKAESLTPKQTYIIANYPNTKEWYKERGILTDNEEKNNALIADGIQKMILSLEQAKNMKQPKPILGIQVKVQNDPEELDKDIIRLRKIMSQYTGIEFEEEKPEEVIEVDPKDEKIEDLEGRIEELTKQIKQMEEDNTKLKKQNENYAKSQLELKDFIVNRCGRIPFVGKRILNEMQKMQKALPEGKEEMDR